MICFVLGPCLPPLFFEEGASWEGRERVNGRIVNLPELTVRACKVEAIEEYSRPVQALATFGSPSAYA
jgi:hypothetical protein